MPIKRVLLFFIVLISLIGVVSAVTNIDTHPSAGAYVSTGALSFKVGAGFNATDNLTITQVCNDVRSTATTVEIYNGTLTALGNLVASSTYYSHCANFSFVKVVGQIYYVMDYNGGSNYNSYGKGSGITYPIAGTSITWVKGYAGGIEASTSYDIVNITSSSPLPPSTAPSIYINSPSNNFIQYVSNTTLVFQTVTGNFSGSYYNTSQALYFENGSLYQLIKTASANVTNSFVLNQTGIYYLNATVTNGSYVLNTSRYSFTLYNLTSGAISVPSLDQNVTSYLNITWSNSSTTNNSVSITNYSVRLLNSDGSANQTLGSTLTNNWSWSTYAYNLSVGSYKIMILTTDNKSNTVNTTQQFNLTRNAKLNVTAYDVSTNVTLSNLNVTLTDLNDSSSLSLNSSGSVLSFDIIRGHLYNLFFDVNGYIYDSVNYTSNQTIYQLVNKSLFKTNSVSISVFDESSLALITNVTGGGSMNITFISDAGSTTYNTSTGILFVSNITAGTYEVKFNAPLYAQRSYYLTVTNRSTQTLNAYLSQSTINLLLTYVNKETGELIENVGVNVYKIINGSWTAVATGFTDITGRMQVSVTTNTNYRFSSSISGYDDKTFNLNPVIFTAYTIQLTKQQASGSQLNFANINVYVINTTFTNNGSNTFSWQISAPSGNLEQYAYSLYTQCKNISSFSGVNAFGGINVDTFNLSCASTNNYVTLKYNYTLTGGELRSFTYTYSIIGSAIQGSFMNNNDETYGMGMFERILIVVLITIVMAGLITKFSNIVAGLGAGLLIMSYLSYIGFIEWWLIAPTLLVGFVLITSWSTSR